MANEVGIQITATGGQAAGQEMAGTAQAATGLAGSVKSVGETAGGILAANTITNLGKSVGAFAQQAINAGDEILSTSRKMGVSTDALQEMRFWAEQAGVSQSGLERAVQTLNQRVGEAVNGNQQYAEAFKRLGVEVTDAQGGIRSTEAVMRDTITALREIEDPAARAAAAAELFGTRMARELLPALDASEMSMDEAAQRAHELGLVMDNEAVAASDQFADSMSALKQTGAALLRDFIMPMVQVIGDNVLPILTDTAALFRSLPDPIQGTAGAVTAVSVAALLLAPRILAVKVALDATGLSMRQMAFRGGAVLTVLTALMVANQALKEETQGSSANIGYLTTDLERLTDKGRVTGELLRLTGGDADEFGRMIELADRRAHGLGGAMEGITGVTDQFSEKLLGATLNFDELNQHGREATDTIEAIDQAMAQMVEQGADGEEVLAALAEQYGLNAEELETLRALLPNFNAAVEQSTEAAADNAEAGDEVAAAWRDAAAELATFTDMVKAQTDPVFAWTQAIENAKEKQDALNDVVAEYGENSPEARDAALDLAEAQIAVFDAEGKLTGSSDELIGALEQMRDDGHLSAAAFRALRDRIRDAERAANNADGTRSRFYEEHYVTTTRTTIHRSIGDAFAFAHGGITGAQSGGVRSRQTLVGEHGPELLNLPPGTQVHSNPDTMRMLQSGGMGGGNGNSVEVVFDFRNVNDSLFASLIVEAIRRATFGSASFRGDLRRAVGL